MTIPFKSHPIEFKQHPLFPSNIFDLLSDDHECYLYNDLFQQLDTSSIESHYKYNGQNAYHPKHIISILIYAYSRGVFSSREIQRRCTEDLSFMYIAQMNCPNFRVLSDFRKNNSAFFHDCFKQTVQLAIELKLASLGHISLVGSKFQANSSKHKAMSYGRLKEKEQALSQEIDELIEKASRSDQEEDQAYKDQTGYEIPEDLKHKRARLKQIREAKDALKKREKALNPDKDIDDKKQISFADKEARIMGKNGSFDYQYNAQISVDGDNQIIIGQHLSQNANDKNEIKPALTAIEETTGKLPDILLSADNGYMSGDNLQALEDSYIATDKGEKKNKSSLDNTERKLVKADFTYHETSDTFTCPGEQTLVVVKQGKDGSRTYQGDAEICHRCSYKSRCYQSNKGEARTINTDDIEALRQQMNEKMEKEESKAIYKQRKIMVEPVFGQIKNTGFRGFSVRGKKKVAGEFSLVCATHNIKKITKAMFRGEICPKFMNKGFNPVIQG